MRIVLKGAAADEYFRLLNQQERIQALTTAVETVAAAVTHLTRRQEQLMSGMSARLNARLDQLETDVAAARDKVVSTVQSESDEDREQNTRLAQKQADLDAANIEIQQLRDQLAQGVTPAEESAIEDRIATLSQKVIDLAAASQVTDPNAPQP